MIVKLMKKYIKTQCGLDKYKELELKTGIYNRLRFYWFVFFASMRDYFSVGKINEQKKTIN